MPTPVKRFKAVGAYIFAGGFTLGVQKHFKVLCHLEGNNYGAATATRNLRIPIHIGQENWPIDNLCDQQPEFVYGNPPCAAWSNNGSNNKAGVERWRTDERVNCTRQHFSLLASLEPQVWAWESVSQAFLKGREFVNDLTQQAIGLGYSVSHVLHDARWLGVPQIRSRYFMICHRIKFEPVSPVWKQKTSSEALAEVSSIPGELLWTSRPLHARQFKDIVHLVQPGERLSSAWTRLLAPEPPWPKNKTGGVLGRPANSNYRLHPNRPATVMTGNFLVLHPTEDRALTFEEQKHLSGFPIDYDFGSQSLSARQCELSRGVCPPVGEWLARSVKLNLLKNKIIKKPTVTLYDFRKPGIDPVDLTDQFNGV